RDAAPAPGTAPVITGPGDLTFDRNTPASATVSATPAGATFTAVRLPDGMSIDPDTGVVSGTPTRAGVFPVTFLAHDVEGIDTVDATFTVELEQLPPTVTPIADQMGDLGAAVSLQVEAADPNGDTLLYSATGLPTGLDIDDTTGLIGGTPTEGGDFAVTVSVDDGFGAVDESFDWAIDPGFVCSVTGNTLTWTDQGASTYYIRHIISGDDNYLGPVSGSLEFTVPSQFGTYKVIAYVGGQIEATCDAPLGQPQPFTCSVVGNTLSWTDQGASTYFIRQLINGEDNYLDSVSGALEYAVPSQFGAYKVVAYVGGRIEAQCDAPLGDPQPFSCSVVGDQLTWTNQGASTYHVRQQVSGVDQYVDSTSGLSLTLPDSFGVFEVRFNLNGQLNTTTCDGVLLPDFTCSVDAAGLVTWADQQSLTYSVRRVVDGINSYVGSSSGLTYQLTDLSGDIRVRYSRSGTMFSTACPPV
ncbi:MAG: Ig domain-containing protein, partial [Actinomycetota bacterium]